MTKVLLAFATAALTLATCSGTPISAADRCSEIDTIRMPGTYLQWIQIAEPIFQKNHLNLEHYNIVIDDGAESVVVELRSTDATCVGKGSTGSHPDFEVEIRKSDKKVLHYNYEK